MLWAIVFLPLLLFFGVASLGAADERASSGSLHLPRLHRRANEGGAQPALQSPFVLTDKQREIVEIYRYLGFLTAQCLCQKARRVRCGYLSLGDKYASGTFHLLCSTLPPPLPLSPDLRHPCLFSPLACLDRCLHCAHFFSASNPF